VLIQVAVPVPGLGLLTYRAADDIRAPAIGARVVVPLGARSVTGIVVDRVPPEAVPIEGAHIRPIGRLLDEEAFVPAEVVGLARWTAEYYAAGPGETITAVLPPKARGAQSDARKTIRIAAIAAGGLELLHRVRDAVPAAAGPSRPLTTRQRDALEYLAAAPGGIAASRLARHGIAAAVVSRLAVRGLVDLRHERVDRDPFHPGGFRAAALDPTRRLTTEQAAAAERLETLVAARSFRVALLHGVTGSGKTELYVRVSAAVRASGRSVLMLVPEIALTPVVASLFRQAFGTRVAIQHSGLSDGERHDQWQRIRGGDIDVVVGTRSAVFAPLARVGLVIVDEEHDASYKQDESPRYHARDVAIVRAQRAGALVVLGSATPSMESYHNAMIGRYERIVLERRVLDRPLAGVTIVDMRKEFAASGADLVFSSALRDAIQARLERREQALVLLNRRGFATAVFCRECAGTFECPNCSVSLVVHGQGSGRRACCHYCNFSTRMPSVCPRCGGPYLAQAGFGTERIESEICRAFPGARTARLDRDAIRRRGALDALLTRFASGEIDVLVGTQMIAKGHDFPRVTLVGVVSADVGLGLADFRASERTFQLLTQVAGRAGRGDRPGEAVVQTLYPDHYSIRLACLQDSTAFFERELQFRRAMRYPPAVALINTIVRSRTISAAMDGAADLVDRLRGAGANRREFRVLGPAPAPLARLRGQSRAQFLMKGTNRKAMREALLAALAARPDLQRHVVVDVDPLNVL
jgi:primosomal protein N' (replication factor Y) (superfamily II helicase)